MSLPLIWMKTCKSSSVKLSLFILLVEKHKSKRKHSNTLTTHGVEELYFNNGFAHSRHGCPQINICRFIFQAATNCLRAAEVTEVFPIIHLVVQLFVAGPGMVNHAHSQPVFVQVLVEGHGEHDGHTLRANPALHMEQVVGQQADSACGSVVILGKGAHFGLGAANRGLRWVMAEASCHVYPVKESDTQLLTTAANQLSTSMSHIPDF